AAEYAACFLVWLLPWFIWTRFVLRISSDLVTQNVAGVIASHAMGSMTNFIWVRFVNLFNAIAPPSFAFYPFPPEAFVDFEFIALPMVVGLVLIGPAFLECRTLWSRERSLVMFGFALPALVILLLFSYVATPALHGWQPMVGAFVFLGATRICRRFSQRSALLLVGLQLLCNFCLLALRGAVFGVHL
ncbi:MAG: hypothetical protein M3Z64_10360, partial [Verrucomicrobiota bacterium]|nr:hypothetical protein [Verrucomicrobiota bacterium]